MLQTNKPTIALPDMRAILTPEQERAIESYYEHEGLEGMKTLYALYLHTQERLNQAHRDLITMENRAIMEVER